MVRVGVDPATSGSAWRSVTKWACSLAPQCDNIQPVNRDIAAIAKIADEVGAGEIIVGLPINMDGTHGQRAQKATDFADRLRAALEVPVILWDERLSTVQATKALLEADLSRRRRREVIDKAAASLILQNYLDFISR